MKLLDGSYQDQALQVGAGNELNDRISITIGNAKASSLGVGGGSSYTTIVNDSSTPTAVGGTALVSGALSLNGYVVGAANSDGVSSNDTSASAIAVAAAINAISGQSGVTATVQATKVAGASASGFATAITSGSVLINGVDIGALDAASSAAALEAGGGGARSSSSSRSSIEARRGGGGSSS
jgi:flagellin